MVGEFSILIAIVILGGALIKILADMAYTRLNAIYLQNRSIICK